MTAKKPKTEDVPQEEVYQPMGVPEPTPTERLEALELRVKVLEGNCRKSHGMR